MVIIVLVIKNKHPMRLTFLRDHEEYLYLMCALPEPGVFVVRVVGNVTASAQLHTCQQLHGAGKHSCGWGVQLDPFHQLHCIRVPKLIHFFRPDFRGQLAPELKKKCTQYSV